MRKRSRRQPQDWRRHASLLQGQPLTKYVPQTNSNRGIMDLLEVIEADLIRVLSETKAEEAQQASEYA